MPVKFLIIVLSKFELVKNNCIENKKVSYYYLELPSILSFIHFNLFESFGFFKFSRIC